MYKHFIRQLKQIQNSNTRFRSLSGDMMTGFVQAAVVGAGVIPNYDTTLVVHGPDPKMCIFIARPPPQLWFDGISEFPCHIRSHFHLLSFA